MDINIKDLLDPHLNFVSKDFITYAEGWGNYKYQKNQYEYAVTKRRHLYQNFERIEHAPGLLDDIENESDGLVYVFFDRMFIHSAHLYGTAKIKENLKILTQLVRRLHRKHGLELAA